MVGAEHSPQELAGERDGHGGGVRRDLAREPARRLEEDLGREVTMEGFVDEERMRALYRESDLYVSLSRSDSTSQSLLEAMATGLLPLVSDIAGNREWVTHRREGYLVPVGDPEALACAIAEAARDPEAPAMRARAREKVVARASFADTITLLEEKLRALASRRGGSEA